MPSRRGTRQRRSPPRPTRPRRSIAASGTSCPTLLVSVDRVMRKRGVFAVLFLLPGLAGCAAETSSSTALPRHQPDVVHAPTATPPASGAPRLAPRRHAASATLPTLTPPT